MKTVVLSVRNVLFAEGIALALKQNGNFRPYQVTPFKSENSAAECIVRKAEILLMEVGEQKGASLEERLRTAQEVREILPKTQIALLCDEVAYPDLAKEVMRAKQSKQVDAFYYASVPAEYLVDALNAL